MKTFENEEMNEIYAEKTSRNYNKRREGKRKDDLKREHKMAVRSGKKHSKMRLQDYDYDEFNDLDLRRYF